MKNDKGWMKDGWRMKKDDDFKLLRVFADSIRIFPFYCFYYFFRNKSNFLHPSSFNLHHSSFILQLLSFSACFIGLERIRSHFKHFKLLSNQLFFMLFFDHLKAANISIVQWHLPGWEDMSFCLSIWLQTMNGFKGLLIWGWHGLLRWIK